MRFGPIHNWVSLLDPRIAPVLSRCGASDLPPTLHMGTGFARNVSIEPGRPTEGARSPCAIPT